MREKFIMSFSGGKDSTLALFRMIQKGYEPIGLLITFNKNENNSFTHGIKRELLNKVSESLNIPLMLVECEGNDYESKFKKALEDAKNMGAKFCAFGDIDIEGHKSWCEDRCREVDIEAVLPLWQEDRESLVYEFIDSGFSTVIKTVNLNYLPSDLLGEVLTKDLVKKIKDLGSDPCGENGEYHTFVVDGPLFSKKIEFINHGIISNENYATLDITIK